MYLIYTCDLKVQKQLTKMRKGQPHMSLITKHMHRIAYWERFTYRSGACGNVVHVP